MANGTAEAKGSWTLDGFSEGPAETDLKQATSCTAKGKGSMRVQIKIDGVTKGTKTFQLSHDTFRQLSAVVAAKPTGGSGDTAPTTADDDDSAILYYQASEDTESNCEIIASISGNADSAFIERENTGLGGGTFKPLDRIDETGTNVTALQIAILSNSTATVSAQTSGGRGHMEVKKPAGDFS